MLKILWLVLLGVLIIIGFSIWKRDGIIQAILNIVAIVSFWIGFSNPESLSIPFLSIGFIVTAISVILWIRHQNHR